VERKPVCAVKSLDPFLARWSEKAIWLTRSTRHRELTAKTLAALRHGRSVDGSITIAAKNNYFAAASPANHEGLVLLLPTERVHRLASVPERARDRRLSQGLVLAALISLLVARSLARAAGAVSSAPAAHSPHTEHQ